MSRWIDTLVHALAAATGSQTSGTMLKTGVAKDVSLRNSLPCARDWTGSASDARFLASGLYPPIYRKTGRSPFQIHHVISDITGATGMAIIGAILNGEQDPEKLAALKDGRIVASRETIARAWSETIELNIYSRSSSLSRHTVNIKNGYQHATSRSRINCESFPVIRLLTETSMKPKDVHKPQTERTPL